MLQDVCVAGFLYTDRHTDTETERDETPPCRCLLQGEGGKKKGKILLKFFNAHRLLHHII